MHLVLSPQDSFSAFSPNGRYTGKATGFRRHCSSASTSSSSSSCSNASPFTSPSRPTAAPVRRTLDFGAAPLPSSPQRFGKTGEKGKGRAEEDESMDVELASSFESTSLFDAAHRTRPQTMLSPIISTSSLPRSPLKASSSQPKSPTPQPALATTVLSPHPPPSKLPKIAKPPLLRRSPYSPSSPVDQAAPSPARSPASFVASYSNRDPQGQHRAQPLPPSSIPVRTAPSLPHQQIQRLRPSVSLTSHQASPKSTPPGRSPLLSPSTSPMFEEPAGFEDARPSPDAFKVSLMKKSGSAGSFGSGGSIPGSVRKALVSPPTPNSKTPLHFDLSPHPFASSRLNSSLSASSSGSTSSPSSSDSSPTNAFSPRTSVPRQRTSYFTSVLPPHSSRPSTSSNLTSSSSSQIVNLPDVARLARPSALCASSSSGSSTTPSLGSRGAWTPVKPTRLFFGAEEDLEGTAGENEPEASSSHSLFVAHQRRRTNDHASDSPQRLGLGLGLPVSFGDSGRSFERSSSQTTAVGRRSRNRTSSGLKRKGSGIGLGDSLTLGAASGSRVLFDGVGKVAEGGKWGRTALKSMFAQEEEDEFKERFDALEKLGEGDGGVVWKVVEKSSGKVGAVKIGRVYNGEKDRLRRLEEADILRTLCPSPPSDSLRSFHHPNIITLSSTWEQSSRLHIHTPLYPRGDLSTFLESLADLPSPALASTFSPHHSGGLDETRCWKLLASLASALALAHERGIVHLDVKPSNVLVGAEGEVVLGDWGYSARLSSREGVVGTEREGDRDYLSAEAVRGVVGVASDIFSLGLLILEALANIVPPSFGSPFHRLREDDFSDLESFSPPTSPYPLTPLLSSSSSNTSTTSTTSSFFSSTSSNDPQTQVSSWGSDPIVRIVKSMMASDPASRPSANDLCGHEVVRRAWEAMEAGRQQSSSPMPGVVLAGPTLQLEPLASPFDLTYLLTGRTGGEGEEDGEMGGVVEGMDSFGFGGGEEGGMEVDESF